MLARVYGNGPMMVAFCGRLAYDGTNYHGFQYQAGVQTIQGVLEEGLSRFVDSAGRVAGAGRTDTGVHAVGQVIAVEVDWRHGPGALQEAWNVHLPPDIHLRQMKEAPARFHPRFDALARTYRYWVMAYEPDCMPNPRRSPLTDRYAYFVPTGLDLDAMNRAAALLVGKHDFASFGWPTQGESTVRDVWAAEWIEHPAFDVLDAYPGRRLAFTITANGFLRRMVRLVVGTLLEVGRGRRSIESVADALAHRDRRTTGPAAPAQGLVLEKVEYPTEFSVWE